MNDQGQYDRIGEAYLAAQSAFVNPREDWGRKRIALHLGDPHGKVIIDGGCGDGLDIERQHALGAKVSAGFDSSQYMIGRAQERTALYSDGYVRRGAWSRIPFPDHFADVITARFSLHYEESLDRPYREAARVLKTGGVFIFLVPHPFSDLQETQKGMRIVEMTLYDGKVIVNYPSHTFHQWFSPSFFENFSMVAYEEYMPHEFGTKLFPEAMVIVAKSVQ